MAALVCSVSVRFSHIHFDGLAKVVDAHLICLPISGSMERLSVKVEPRQVNSWTTCNSESLMLILGAGSAP